MSMAFRSVNASYHASQEFIPLVMRGISMAPWLQNGDILLVNSKIQINYLRLGDIAVFEHRESKVTIAHRVISKSPLRTKGDRNKNVDLLNEEWNFKGRVEKRFRDNRWTGLRFRYLFWWFCSFGLYPGQRLPKWMTRTNFLKLKNLCAR